MYAWRFPTVITQHHTSLRASSRLKSPSASPSGHIIDDASAGEMLYTEGQLVPSERAWQLHRCWPLELECEWPLDCEWSLEVGDGDEVELLGLLL